MRRTRMIAAAATLTALLGAVVGAGPAGASPSGVGTSKATDTILNVALGNAGSLFNLRVLGDDGSASIDPTVAKPSAAATSLTALTAKSTSLPAIGAINTTLGQFSAQSTGAQQTTGSPVSLTTPSSGPLAGFVANGSVNPATLTAAVDSTGARAGLNTVLNDVSLAGGLLSLPTVSGSKPSSNLGANALTGAADGLRGLSIPSLQVLNLGAVLQGLGIDVTKLPLTTVTGLLTQLQETVAANGGVLSPNAVKTLIDGIGTQLTALSGQTGTDPLSGLPGGDPTSTIVGLLPAGVTAPVTVDDALAALNTQLTDLLNSLLGALTNAPLLEVDNVQAGLVTKAADTVANSVATVTASLGRVWVGNIVVTDGVDLGSTAAQVSSLVNGVASQVNGVLTTLDPGLAGLVSVKVLDQNKSITSSGGYTHALASLTALHVAVTPPAALTSIVRGLNASETPISGLFPQGSTPDPVSQLMSTLNSTLGVSALGGGATVDAVSLSSTSDFTVPASPGTVTPNAPSGTLAVTGSGTQLLGLAGLLLLALGVTARWLRRRAMTA